jgi:hypothetical protein
MAEIEPPEYRIQLPGQGDIGVAQHPDHLVTLRFYNALMPGKPRLWLAPDQVRDLLDALATTETGRRELAALVARLAAESPLL